MNQAKNDTHPTFALIVSPGLERSALKELRFWWQNLGNALASVDSRATETKPIDSDKTANLDDKNVPDFPEYQIDHGVLEFQAPLFQGLMLNHVLKIPTRILLRISTFRCRDFPKLHRQAVKIKWKSYCQNELPQWEVAASKSRVAVEKKIESTLEDAFLKYWKEQGKPIRKPKDSQKQKSNETSTTGVRQKIYIRIHEDDCTISVDTSGAALFKRGIRTQINTAPLRETLAAGLIYSMLPETISGIPEKIVLWDPMTGSGCIPLEAANLLKPIPWGEHPFYRWKICIEKNIRKAKTCLDGFEDYSYFSGSIGSDLSQKAIHSTSENKNTLVQKQKPRNLQTIAFAIGDFFDEETSENFGLSPELSKMDRHLLINPPYDVRLPTDQDPYAFYDKTLKHAAKNPLIKKIGIIIPKKPKLILKAPKNWVAVEKISMKNGGIPTLFYIFDRKN